MFALNEKELKEVAGGSDRERSIMVKVIISDCGPFAGEVSIKPYLDGILLSDQEQKVDGSCDNVNVLTRGRGLAMLAVIIDDKAVKNYVIDFDKGSYFQR